MKKRKSGDRPFRTLDFIGYCGVCPQNLDATRLAEKVEAFFAKNPDKRNLHYKTGLLSIDDM